MTDVARQFAVGGGPRVEVRFPSGSLRVRGGSPEEIHVQVRGRRAEDFLLDQRGDTVYVEFEARGLSASHEVAIHVPDGTAVEVRTASADVESAADLSDLTVATASGDVLAGDAGGQVDIRTASGDIKVDRAGEWLRVRTASGDVRVARADGGASIVSASGDVTIGAAQENVTVKTASGRVRIGEFDGTTFAAKTVSGDIAVRVPTGRTLHVDLQTLSGNVRIPGEPGVAGNRHEPSRQVTVKGKSVSGDIAVGTST
jgi:DUF4097 and DUF4098 domain-containing protein YvlB